MKEPHFDESNILATLHPADKDYGFMKIDEPKTPYGAYDSDQEEDKDELDANLLAARIAAEGHKGPRTRRASEPSGDEEDLKLLSPEERAERLKFEQKRKAHYNEFYAVKMARQLLDQEEDEDDQDTMGDTDESIAVSKDIAAEVEECGGTEAAQTSTTPAADSTVDDQTDTELKQTPETMEHSGQS